MYSRKQYAFNINGKGNFFIFWKISFIGLNHLMFDKVLEMIESKQLRSKENMFPCQKCMIKV